MNDPDLKLLAVILLAVVLGVAAWYYRDDFFPPPQPEPISETAEPVQPVTDTGPRHPLPDMNGTSPATGKLVPLPPLDDSDAYFLLEVGNTLGTDIEALLLRDAVIDRLVTTTDNLTRAHVSEKIRPVRSLATSFQPSGAGNDAPAYLGSENYQRYELLVASIAAADIDTVVDIYRRFYPLFQKSYERLGYPDAYFNDRVIEVIDHLLATPQPDGPVMLTRPNVLYEFADPSLESLSSGQKLLIRMGNENANTIKQVLRTFRERLASQ
jgi:hypothetical protein